MRRREWLTAIASLATLAIAIFAVGGAFRWTQSLVALAVGVAVAFQLPSRRTMTRVSPLLAVIALAIGLTLVQLLPLPGALLDLLQPEGSALRDDGTVLAGTDPWHALTLDVPGTLRALCFFVIVLGVAWTALRQAVSETGRYRVLVAVAAACGAVALVVAIHELLGIRELYGVYRPHASPSVLGPLLNENHLGGLMAMGTTVALGLAMQRRQASWLRALWLLTVAACGVTTVASQSRGATLALIAGALVTAGTLLAQKVFGETRKRARASFATTSLPIGVVMASTIVVVVYASAGGVSSQLERTTVDEAARPTSKVAIWRSTVTLVEDSPVLGVGRGAFEPAFTRVHPAAAIHTFAHVENEYLQVLADWGVIGALLFGLGTVWIAAVAFRRWRDGPLTAGALGATVAIALQSMVDFGVELLGLAVPLVAILATLTYVPLKEAQDRALAIARALRAALVVACVVAFVLLLAPATRPIADDHSQLAQRNVDAAQIRDSLERHPLDYYGYARMAQLLASTGDPRAVQFLNHALRLHPTHHGLHHMAADLLYRAQRPEQAAIEYASAMRTSPKRHALLREILGRLPPAIAVRAIPTTFDPLETILHTLYELERYDIAIDWLARVLDEHPGRRTACDRLYTIIANRHDLRAAEIASARCTDISHDARVVIARLLVSKQRYDEALAMLRDVERWRGHKALMMQAWLTVCDVHEVREQFDEAKRCLRRLDMTENVDDDGRREIMTRLERIAETLRSKAAGLPPPK